MKILLFQSVYEMLKTPITCLYGGIYKSSELYFKQLLSLLMAKRKLKSFAAVSAKSEYSNFVNVILKEKEDEFLFFRKETGQLEKFFWKFIGGSSQFIN